MNNNCCSYTNDCTNMCNQTSCACGSCNTENNCFLWIIIGIIILIMLFCFNDNC